VIVLAAVTQEANDKKQLVPMLEQVEVLTGSKAQQATADTGCFSEQNVADAKLQGIDLFVVPDRQKQGEKPPGTTGPPPPQASVAEQMRRKLRTPEEQAVLSCARRWRNRFLDKSKNDKGLRDFCCEDWRKCRRSGR
jgi:hypothetical protein